MSITFGRNSQAVAGGAAGGGAARAGVVPRAARAALVRAPARRARAVPGGGARRAAAARAARPAHARAAPPPRARAQGNAAPPRLRRAGFREGHQDPQKRPLLDLDCKKILQILARQTFSFDIFFFTFSYSSLYKRDYTFLITKKNRYIYSKSSRKRKIPFFLFGK